MKARWWAVGISLVLLAVAPVAGAAGLGVEIWTSRGNDAVYQPGERLEVEARASADGYLLVYEIDAEGSVYLLYPFRNDAGLVQAGKTYVVPPEHSNVDLVVDGPVGQCYLVAIASRAPFGELPWYLRPYDMQAEQVGYDSPHPEEEGITAEGRIVGDPFVAIERIRRRVVGDSQDPEAFGTSYVSYYVHNEVKYPRYLCYDCHRPNQWAWWTDFDPYYTHCSVIDFRVNYGWAWGPTYWFGYVPYYSYYVRPDCPPYYATWCGPSFRYSSWNGWACWNQMWGTHLTRYKSAPPKGYLPPSKFPDQRNRVAGAAGPPGFINRDPSGRSGRVLAGNINRSGQKSSRGMFGSDGLNRSRQASAWGRGATSSESSRQTGESREGRSRTEGPPGSARGDRLEWPGSRRGDSRETRGGMGWASRGDAPARGSSSQRLEWPGSRRDAPARGNSSQRLEWPGSRRDAPARGSSSQRIEWPGSRSEGRSRGEQPGYRPFRTVASADGAGTFRAGSRIRPAERPWIRSAGRARTQRRRWTRPRLGSLCRPERTRCSVCSGR